MSAAPTRNSERRADAAIPGELDNELSPRSTDLYVTENKTPETKSVRKEARPCIIEKWMP